VLAPQPDPAQQVRFESDSAEIGAAFAAAASPFLPAYAGRAWPVDPTLAIASLRLHDALLPARYGSTVGWPARSSGSTRRPACSRLGISLPATVVTLGAARVQGDARLAGALASYGDFAGLPVDTPWTRRYAFGVLPIGDAFLAWSKTARPLVAAAPAPPPSAVSRGWRLPLLTLFLLVGAAPWLAIAARRRASAS
jgi:hypothetical protein